MLLVILLLPLLLRTASIAATASYNTAPVGAAGGNTVAIAASPNSAAVVAADAANGATVVALAATLRSMLLAISIMCEFSEQHASTTVK